MKIQELLERLSQGIKRGDRILYYGDKIPRPRSVEAVPATAMSVDGESLTLQLANGEMYGVLTSDCKVVPKPVPVAPPNLELEPIGFRNQRYGPK